MCPTGQRNFDRSYWVVTVANPLRIIFISICKRIMETNMLYLLSTAHICNSARNFGKIWLKLFQFAIIYYLEIDMHADWKIKVTYIVFSKNQATWCLAVLIQWIVTTQFMKSCSMYTWHNFFGCLPRCINKWSRINNYLFSYPIHADLSDINNFNY